MVRQRQPAGTMEALHRSGVARGRAAIGRALAGDLEVQLPDEAFGALEALGHDALNLEVRRIWMQRDCTVVLVEHAIKEAIFWPIASRCSRRGRPASRR